MEKMDLEASKLENFIAHTYFENEIFCIMPRACGTWHLRKELVWSKC
uniref:Uncharacterized protein n=1 Tax=Rhizophora mucronata TaxID=61149 RepID=A0A2P2K512_RHIMU